MAQATLNSQTITQTPPGENKAAAIADALLTELDAEDQKAQAEASLGKQVDELLDAVDTAASKVAQASEAVGEPFKVQEKQEVAQIDSQLAAHADDAVAGEFETVNDVLGADKAAAGTPSSAAVPANDPQARAAQPADEQEVQGSFQTPEDVAGTNAPKTNAVAPATGFSASAADVARELDSDTSIPTTENPDAKPARTKRRFSPVSIGGSIICRACYTLNLALKPLSPATRNLVGYIGLITLLHGLVLCGLTFAKHYLGGH